MAKKGHPGVAVANKTQMLSRCVPAATDSQPNRVPANAAFTKKPRGCDNPCMGKQLTRAFFSRSVLEVAPDLIGAILLVNGVGGRLVEVEAYHHTDPAAHSYHGPTARNAVMFGPPGFIYVYRSYGIHWCLNFVCEPKGSASAVLIRAIEPTTGLPLMRRRRGTADERLLCSGPGRLCEALGITGADNGSALNAPPFKLLARTTPVEVVAGPRIGLTKAVDKPWRYGLKDSRFLSKPFAADAKRVA
jgi:DNA-3-methyladenine glycosylase